MNTATINAIRHLGETFRDGDYAEHTSIVDATVTGPLFPSGKQIRAAVLTDGNGNVIEPETSFDVGGADNVGMAVAVLFREAGDNDPVCAAPLVELEITEAVVRDLRKAQ